MNDSAMEFIRWAYHLRGHFAGMCNAKKLNHLTIFGSQTVSVLVAFPSSMGEIYSPAIYILFPS